MYIIELGTGRRLTCDTAEQVVTVLRALDEAAKPPSYPAAPSIMTVCKKCFRAYVGNVCFWCRLPDELKAAAQEQKP